MNVQVGIDDFPKFMFLDNINDAKISIQLGDSNVKTAKDLFFFFVDLLIKGIVLLFGGGEKSVLIDDLSHDDIKLLVKKFANIGLALNVDITPRTKSPGEVPAPEKNIVYELCEGGTDDRLEAYRLRLLNAASTIRVSFRGVNS